MDYYKAAPDQDIIDEHIAAPPKRRTINSSRLREACDRFVEHQRLLDAGLTELDVLADIHRVHK